VALTDPRILFTAFPLMICGVCVTLALFAFLRRGGVAGSLPFGFLFIAASIYAGASGLEHASVDLGSIVGWIKVEYVGVVFLGPLWLLFALRFSGHRSPSLLALAALFLEPVAVLVALLNPRLFSSFYSGLGTKAADGMVVFTATRGPLFWTHLIITSAMLAAGAVVLIDHARRSSIAHRGNAMIAVAGSLVPWIANIFYVAGITPGGADLGPYAVAVSGILFAWALFSRNLLDVVSVARERVLETMGDGVLVADGLGAVVDCNPAARRFLGIEDPKPASAARLFDDPRFADLAALVAAGQGERELLGMGPEHDLEVRAHAFPVADDAGRLMGIAIVLSDVTQTSALLNRLRLQASLDGLTGAMNRRRFTELATRDIDLARRSLRSVALVMIDLDRFKDVNDRFGHAAGDEVLKAVVTRCQVTLRTTDLFCRFGGEEFALLLPNTDATAAQLVAERLRALISTEPVAWEGGQIRTTASFGLFASIPAEGEDLDLFLRTADAALYEAKTAGRDRVVVSR